jgi:hypothetical protein
MEGELNQHHQEPLDAMQQAIGLDLLITTSEEGFSLDEFVIKLKDCANREGLAGVVRLVLLVLDERLMLRQTGAMPGVVRPCARCGHTKFACRDRVARRLRTGVGTVKFVWRRLACCGCKKMMLPLRDVLLLRRWQSKATELEKTAMEIFTEQSYRRGADALGKIGVIPLPRSTAQRWVMQSDAGRLDEARDDLRVVMADGTGFKRRPDAPAGRDNQGEVRVGVGLTRTGRWVPLGAHTGESWQQIADDLRKRTGNHPPELAVCDGGRGLAEALSTVAGNVQRCEWHLLDQLRYALYEDGVKKPEQKPHLDELAATLFFQLPEGELEPVRSDERDALEKKMLESAAQMDALVATLRDAGHLHASLYLQQAQRHTFRWLAFWLKTGLKHPRTTSYLERLMREIGRRLKKIAFGWSEKGAAQMTRILIRKIVHREEWDAYWKKRMRLNDQVCVLFRRAHLATP